MTSKSKGSRYEREFVERCQDAGLVARRVPLSGAMAGYPDDVVVADTWRIECKYRAKGTGFKSLYRWLGEHEAIDVKAKWSTLRVMRLEDWCLARVAEIDGTTRPVKAEDHESSSAFSTLTKWIGESHYLAVRMPRSPWLVIEFIQQDTL
jgi:Holliday junction resolvase